MTDEFTSLEVDGIPVLVAPRSDHRTSAGLFFRVGRADETLATAGITHLVEHLALHDHGVSDLHYNGQTADLFTHFHVEGTEAHVVEYLNGVCAALADLPIHRLDVEKDILRTEATGRGGGPAAVSALYRYGAQGYGLSAYQELGLPRLDAETVRAWSAQHFTRENAVLWIAGDGVPDGLRLELPSGRRNPLPEVTSALPKTPAWYGAPGDLAVVNGLVERSTRAMLFTRILSRALYQDLRQRGGLSYQAGAAYLPRDRDHAIIELVADSLPEKSEAVIGGIVDTLARLRWGAITEAELESARDHMRDQVADKDWPAMVLPGAAINVLIGKENISREQAVTETDALTETDVHEVADEFYASALAQVPALGLDWAGFVQAPEESEVRLTGRQIASKQRDGSTLVVAHEGLTMVSEGRTVTIRFSDVVAMQKYADGARVLYGRDGFRLAVEPSFYPLDQKAQEAIDVAVPPDKVISLPARSPSDIPQPQPSASGADSRLSRLRPLLAALLTGVAAVWFAAVAIGVAVDDESRGTSAGWAGAVICGAIAAYLAWTTRKLWRRWQQQRG
jgi:Peptidase M16 inactive domain